MASQIEIVQGLRMAERVAARFELGRNPEFNPALRIPSLPARLRKWAASWFGPARPSARSEEQIVAQLVQNATAAKTVKASRVMEISFTTESPALAAAAANAVIETYIADQLAVKAEAVRRATDWLDTRVAELRRDVRDGEDRIAAYRARQGLVQGVQASLATEQISKLTADMVQARSDLADAQSRLEAARGRSGQAAQATTAPSVVALRAQRDQISGQLQSLMARLGPEHPTASGLRNQLSELERAASAETGRIVAAIEGEVRAAKARIGALEQEVGSVRTQVDRNAQSEVPLNAMQRDAEAGRTLLQTALERVQQTAQQTALEFPDARLVSPAIPPAKPSSPKMLLLMAGGSGAGVFLGLLLVDWLETADGTFRSGEDVRASLALPCFALVPEMPRAMLRRIPIAEYAARKPLSPFAEQLRALRAGLWLGPDHPRVIAITAARPSEGKTTIAIGLGRIAAMSGERAIVLDCDVRQPSFGRLMQADGELGVMDCLLGHAKLDRYHPQGPAHGHGFRARRVGGGELALPVHVRSNGPDAGPAPPELRPRATRRAARLRDDGCPHHRAHGGRDARLRPVVGHAAWRRAAFARSSRGGAGESRGRGHDAGGYPRPCPLRLRGRGDLSPPLRRLLP